MRSREESTATLTTERLLGLSAVVSAVDRGAKVRYLVEDVHGDYIREGTLRCIRSGGTHDIRDADVEITSVEGSEITEQIMDLALGYQRGACTFL